MTPKNIEQVTPAYGASEHYIGEAGQTYFNQKYIVSEQSVRWHSNLWVPHLTHQDRVLDFGCGGGDLLDHLPGKVKIGVEINPAARQQAKAKSLDVYASLEEIQANKLRFSRIISSHALEHIPNPHRVLESLKELLEDGGQLILLLPLDDWRARHQSHFRENDPDHHLYAWTPQTLGNLLIEAGLQPQTVNIVSDCLPPRAISHLIQLPVLLRSLVGRICSTLLYRRQLFAIAIRQKEGKQT